MTGTTGYALSPWCAAVYRSTVILQILYQPGADFLQLKISCFTFGRAKYPEPLFMDTGEDLKKKNSGFKK